VKEKLDAEGDLGTVAQTCKSKQRTLGFGMSKPKPLLVSQVLNTFREIANISGTKSQQIKVEKIKKLLVQVQDSTETKYIIRGLQGKLRIGLAQSTVLISLAHALSLTIPATVQPKGSDNVIVENAMQQENDKDDKDATLLSSVSLTKQQLHEKSLTPEKRLEAAVNIIKQVYSEVPSYDALLDAALTVPLAELPDMCGFQPGIPVAPMLAKPTKSIQEVFKRLSGRAFTCEFKYDGERAQIHQMADGQVKVFSRNLLETSSKFPEVPRFVQQAADAAVLARNEQGAEDDHDEDTPSNSDYDNAAETGSEAVTSFVLDAEVVAYNPKTKQLVPFQVLSTRKKTEESSETAKVQVIVQAFDLMYLNGRSLLSVSLKQRRKLMKRHFAPVEGKFHYATALDFQPEDGEDTLNLEQFLDTSVKGQCEGLMVKTLDDVYEPSRRSLHWLKLKKDYLDGLGDSVDLVPLGAYKGRGKRTGVYGAYLLACFDADTEEFQSVCKIGTGFSDEDLQTLSAALNEHAVECKPSIYSVADGLECDVWFEPVQVWEVKAADLSQSSLHRGAMGKTGDPGRGIGLRFPRYERLRPDKKPEQATTSDQILEMYYQQDSINKDDGNNDDDEDGI
jgi:DNA ligase 1